MKIKASIGITVFILVMALAYAGMKIYSGYAVRAEIDRTIRETPSIADIDYEKISFNYFRPEFRIKALTAKLTRPEATLEEGSKGDSAGEGILKVDEIIIYKYLVEKGFPTDIHFEANGIHLDTTRYPLNELHPCLKEMGYRNIEADLACEYTFDPKNKTLDLKQLYLRAENFGELEFSTRLKNINLPKIVFNPNDVLYLLTLLPAISISKVAFSYRDDSLVKRLYRLNAGKHGRPVKDLVLDAAQWIESEIGAAETASTRRSMEAVVKFLLNPEKIRTTIRPEKPVPLGRLIWVKRPGELIEVLNAEVEI